MASKKWNRQKKKGKTSIINVPFNNFDEFAGKKSAQNKYRSFLNCWQRQKTLRKIGGRERKKLSQEGGKGGKSSQHDCLEGRF